MPEWWRSAVLYEVYVRSFADSNGDGVGDVSGIRARLGYLHDLGVDGVSLTPFFPSPGADHGYDVSDYVDVDPQFGTIDELDALVDDAHELGLRVTIDVVPNHTSSDHPWRDAPSGALVFERVHSGDRVVCTVNVSTDTLRMPEGEVLLASDRRVGDRLPADAAAWVRLK